MIARRRKEGSNSKNGGNKQQKENANTNNQKSSSKKEKLYNGESKQHKPHKFRKDFGFTLQDIRSWENFVKFMYKPMDPASLGLIRIMFGFLMVFDIPEERGLANADIYWGDPTECRFPLFNFLKPLQLQWMCIIYFIMWLGALGIMLGFHFHKSCLAFSATYWYLFLLDKTSWNNHSYMYGVISILLLGSQANHFWSLDILLGRVQSNCPVPLWNYFILRFQIFILYFYAGLKKMDMDWLQGYSMRNLSNHWVFEPFRMVLTPEQVDYWLIHVTGFMLDLSIGFFLMINKTRPLGLFFLGMFHVMNSQLFSIGMFPYVCLATMPIFCDANWPRKILKVFVSTNSTGTRSDKHKENSPDDSKTALKSRKSQESLYNESIGWKHKLVVGLLISHIGVQAFLPYSHFITKGYNNWTYGLYGYSWDMMVHTWDTVLVVVKVVDNESGKEHFLDPEAWVQSNRWEKHGDMLIQYAHCLKGKLLTGVSDDGEKTHQYTLSNNISIYLDVWCSLNGRFQQRMFNPRVDLLTVEWSPFKEVSFLMPLLTEFSDWRDQIVKLEKEVYSWSQWSDVLFVADFPGLSLENYINEDLSNVTLSLLEGEVVVETEILEKETEENKKKRREAVGLTRRRLEKQESIKLPAGRFHRVVTVSKTPACYMYTYTNKTKQIEDEETAKGNQTEQEITSIGTPFVDKFIERASRKVRNFLRAIGLVSNAILNVLYSVPMVKRVRVA